MKLKTAPSAIPSGADIVRELDRRVQLAEEAIPKLYARYEELKASGAGWPVPPGAIRLVNHRDAAEAILAGADDDDAASSSIVRSPENELFEIEEKIARLKLVVELGRARAFRIRLKNAGDIAADLERAWRQNLADLAGHILEMRHLADARKALAAEWHARTGVQPTFDYEVPADRASGLIVGSPQYEFVDLLRRGGLIQ